MNVAICHPVFWPEVRRGAERYARELADGLAARGHRPRIVTTHGGRPRTTVEDGVPVHRGWRPPDGRLARRGFEPFLGSVPATYLSLRRGDDDLVQALQPADGLAAARWRRRTGRPVVLAYMGIPHRRAVVHRRYGIEALAGAVRGASATTALSAYARDAFHRWFGVEARVIHPPVDTAAFAPGPERTADPTVVFAADPREPRKRFGLIAAAWPLVRRAHPRARLLVNAAPGLALPEGAHAVDLDDRSVLAATYARAWASALPSWGEAFGLVLAEALACGTPVVGAREGGIPEVLGDQPVGALFDGDAPEDVARAILEALELARDPSATAACRARGETFSTARCAAAHEALYRELS